MTTFQSIAISCEGIPSIAILPRVTYSRACRGMRMRCRTSRDRRRSPLSCPAFFELPRAAFARIDARVTRFPGEFEAHGFKSVITTWRAPVDGDAAAMIPIGPTVTRTSSPNTEIRERVYGIAKGRRCRQFHPARRFVNPHVCRGQRNIFGEGAWPVHTTPLV